jgi:hypothetical protein
LLFLTKENVEPVEILIRLTAQFGDETPSRIQVYDWSKPFKEGRTEIGNMRRRNIKASYSSIF